MNGCKKNKNGAKKRLLIYNTILKYPGLHFRELSRKLNIPKSTLEYHLRLLIKQNLIISESEKKYTRYYGLNNVGEVDKKLLKILRQDMPFKIIQFLYLNPKSSQTKICEYIEKDPSTISFHLDKLKNIDLVEINPNGKKIECKIKNEENLKKFLLKYKGFF